MGWFRNFRSFFADMFHQWVGGVTGFLSIILGVFPLVFPVFFSGDRGFIHTQWAWWAASALAFLIAAYSAWGKQRTKRVEAENKVAELKKRLEDNRPILGMNAESTIGRSAWAEHPIPVMFTIQHLTGRLPTAIRFDLIPSKNGKFSLCFDALPHVERPPQRTPISYEVFEAGASQLSASDWEATRPHQKQMLGMFLDDSPMELIELDYSLVVHFLDGTDQRSQEFTLTFDKLRSRFLINPLVNSPS